jgi:serine/threonine protein kinase
MTPTSRTVTGDQALAELVERCTARIEAGEALDAAALARDYPEYAERLGELLPALRALAALERSASRGGSTAAAVGRDGAPAGVLGDFRIVGELGRGGMGVVYEAEQLSLGRRVALKVLPFAATLDPRHLQRFRNEAQAAAHLHHPHIVPVFAVGCERGVHYYAMQLIDGQTVAALLRALRGGTPPAAAGAAESTLPYAPQDYPPPAQAAATPRPAPLSTERAIDSRDYFRNVARLGVQAAEALDHAHQSGVVHRDVKPANLMVDGRGHLWVTDFGLARFQADANLTLTGDLVGTLRYMSPEQALARRGVVDHRTDVYSLGATLYELLTLEPAFPGDDRADLLRRIAQEEPSAPRRRNRAIPRELETIVLKAMARNPAERYATAQDLADDLQRFLDDKPIQARRPSPGQRLARLARRHKYWVGAAVGVLLLALAGLSVSNVLVWRERQRAERRSQRARQVVNDMYTRFAEKWLAEEAGMEEVQREFLLKALAFYEELSAEEGGNPAVRYETGMAYRRVGDIQRKLHQFDKAEQAYRQAVTVLERLVADAPGVPEYRQELALAHHNRGNLLREVRRAEESERAWRLAREIRTELARQHPDVPGYQRDLAGSSNNLAIRLTDTAKPDEAEETYREALAVLTRLAAEHPGTGEYRYDLGRGHTNLGLFLAKRKRPGEAELEYRKSIELLERLVATSPRVSAYRQALAVAHYRLATLAGGESVSLLLGLPGLCHGPAALGAVLATAGRARVADQSYRRALELEEKLVDDFPRSPSYRHELAKSYEGFGVYLKRSGRIKEAGQACEIAQRHWGWLAREYPDDPAYRIGPDLQAPDLHQVRVLPEAGTSSAPAMFGD